MRQQPGQPVQLFLGRVEPGLAEGRFALRAHHQAERRQVGPLRAGLLGEAAALFGGFGVHTGLVPVQGDRKWW